jgi:hypothetical protein
MQISLKTYDVIANEVKQSLKRVKSEKVEVRSKQASLITPQSLPPTLSPFPTFPSSLLIQDGDDSPTHRFTHSLFIHNHSSPPDGVPHQSA